MIAAIQPGLEMCWVSRPRGAGSHVFQPLTSSTLTPTSSNDWTNLIVEVYGAGAGKVVLDVEWYINVEFVVNPAQALSRLAPPNVTNNLFTEASAYATNEISSFVKGGVRIAGDALKREIQMALNQKNFMRLMGP
jgi:hypothetical protein